MPRPICIACEVEMSCEKNEHLVKEGGCYDPMYWSGDRYGCPSCGVQIVTGFGAGMIAEAGNSPEGFDGPATPFRRV